MEEDNVFYFRISLEICEVKKVELKAAGLSFEVLFNFLSFIELPETVRTGLSQEIPNDIEHSLCRFVKVQYRAEQAWVKSVSLKCIIDGFETPPFLLDLKHLQVSRDFPRFVFDNVSSLTHNTEVVLIGEAGRITKVSILSGSVLGIISIDDLRVTKMLAMMNELFVLGENRSGVFTMKVFCLSTEILKRQLFSKLILGKPMLEQPLDFEVSEKCIVILDSSKKTSKVTLKYHGLDGKAIKTRKLDLFYDSIAQVKGTSLLILGIKQLSQVHCLDEISGNFVRIISLSSLPVPDSYSVSTCTMIQLVSSPAGFYALDSSGCLFCFDNNGKFLRVSDSVQSSGPMLLSTSNIAREVIAAVRKDGKFELIRMNESL
jgi:hypothetical protein